MLVLHGVCVLRIAVLVCLCIVGHVCLCIVGPRTAAMSVWLKAKRSRDRRIVASSCALSALTCGGRTRRVLSAGIALRVS
jgi:hypothetical protein